MTGANLDEPANLDDPIPSTMTDPVESEHLESEQLDSDEGDADVPAPPKRRVDKSLLLVSVVIAIGVVLVGRGLATAITGNDRVKLPEQVEEVDPVPEAVQVLSQTRVFVDLIADYTGVLVIDGVEIPTIDIGEVASQQNVDPGEQVSVPPATIYEAGNATLTFVPSDDAAVTKFDTGLHDATVIYWKVDEGRQFSHSFSWTFSVV